MAKRIAMYLSWVSLAAVVGCAAVFAFCYTKWAPDLPSITRVGDYSMPQVTTVYARDKSIIGYLFQERRFPLSLDNMPAYVPKAFVAIEDARFFQHKGIDYLGIARAMFRNIQAGEEIEGASTITQQLIKILLLSPRRTYERKFKEAILAYRLENYLTKQDILYLYLNLINFGNGAYGVEAAARTYFGKHAKDLSIAEAAMLAGLPKAPSLGNPYKNPERALSRQKAVLKRMFQLDYISEEEYGAAVKEELVYRRMPDPSWKSGAWYLEEVRRRLLAFFAEENARSLGLDLGVYGSEALYQGGFHIYTAMDPKHQQAAEAALRGGLREADRRHGWRGALENKPGEEREAFINAMAFAPEMLAEGGWAKALVVGVDAGGADVRLGGHKGRINVQSMAWCRKPDPRVAAAAAARIKDARQVLRAGDVVFVSAAGAFDPAKAGQAETIALNLEQAPELQGALVSMEVPDGDVVALVGGYDFSFAGNQFNRAVKARRQPGSSFKPVVYSAALDQGYAPGTIVYDTEYAVPDIYTGKVWTPGNSDGRFLGPIPLSRALAASRNVCTVRVAQQIGMSSVIGRAKDLGLGGDIPPFLPVSLGSHEATPLEMAVAYTAFAGQGKRAVPRFITRIDNRWGEPLVAFEPDSVPAVSPQNAFVMAHLLKGVVSGGTGTAARELGRPMAGKTGTSNNERDAWFIGFTPHLVTSVYVGYDDNSPMGRSEYGGKAALPVFVGYRKAVEPGYPPDDFSEPEGIVWLGGGQGAEAYPYFEGVQPRVDTAGGEASPGETLLRGMF